MCAAIGCALMTQELVIWKHIVLNARLMAAHKHSLFFAFVIVHYCTNH